MKETSVKYFLNGYSCSESIVQAAIDKGYIPKEMLSAATSFSGGMGIKCLCGAVAGAQIVIGAMYGRNDNGRDSQRARALAKEFCERFAAKYKVNCCKALSSGFDFHSPERKNHCSEIVKDSSEILEALLKENLINV